MPIVSDVPELSAFLLFSSFLHPCFRMKGLEILHLIQFGEFPEAMGEVVDELAALLRPYQIGVGIHPAHLLAPAITRRRHIRLEMRAALRQPLFISSKKNLIDNRSRVLLL